MTQPISGPGPIGGGNSYSDSQAVAAYLAWAERQIAQNQAPQVATAAYQTYLQLTTTDLFGGSYKFTLTALAGGPNVAQGTDVELQLLIDGFPIAGPLQEFGVALGRFGFTATFVLPFSPGVHTLAFQHRQPASPGVSGILGANWVLERWA